MIRRSIAALALAALAHAAPAGAEDGLDFAGDAFRAGGSVAFAGSEARDAFLMGERVQLAAPTSGAAHLAGRRVETTAPVGGALYAFGGDVRVAAPVAGAASLAGYDVVVAAEIGGNLRAMGTHVEIGAPVSGGAILFAQRLELDAPVAGDAMIAADELAFGAGARIDGRLTLFEEEGELLDVPASVVPPERLDRRPVAHRGGMAGIPGPGWAALAASFVVGVLVLAAFATLVALIAPARMTRLRAIAGDGPFRSLGAGFLALSALVGAAIVLAVTVIGIVVAPFAIIAAVLLGILGYVVAVYLIGVWAVTRAGALEPDTFPEYVLAALVGALLVGLAALLPFVGWLVILAVTFVGVGAIVTAWLRPRLYPLA